MKVIKALIMFLLILSLVSCTARSDVPVENMEDTTAPEPTETPMPTDAPPQATPVPIYFPPEYLGRAVIPSDGSKDLCAEEYLKEAGIRNGIDNANAAAMLLADDMFFSTFEDHEFSIEITSNGYDQVVIALSYGTFEKTQLEALKNDVEFCKYWKDRYRPVLLDYLDVAGIMFQKSVGNQFDIGVIVLDKTGKFLYAVTDYGIKNDYLLGDSTYSGEELGKDLMLNAMEREYFPKELIDEIPAIDPSETENEKILEISCRIDEYKDFSAEELLNQFHVKPEFDFQNENDLTIENFISEMLTCSEIEVTPKVDDFFSLELRFNQLTYADFAAMRESETYGKEFEKFWKNYIASIQKTLKIAEEMHDEVFYAEIETIMIDIIDAHGMTLYSENEYRDWGACATYDYIYEKYDN